MNDVMWELYREIVKRAERGVSTSSVLLPERLYLKLGESGVSGLQMLAWVPGKKLRIEKTSQYKEPVFNE